jgi:hypothetical protein
MRHLIQVVLVSGIMCSAIATVVGQTVYKWTDADGVTHYSEQPPVAVKAKQLMLNGGVPASVSATAASVPASSQSATAGALDAARRDYPKQACASAQINLKQLSSDRMVLDSSTAESPPGAFGPRALTPEQRDAAKLKAQQQIQQYCERG